MLLPSRPRVLALTAFVLAAIQVVEGVKYFADVQYLSVLLILAAFFGVLASVKLWRDNCFESRFALAMIALCTVAGHGLSLSAGLPGSDLQAWTGANAVLGFISLAAALLILLMLLPRFFSDHSKVSGGPPV